MRKIEKLFCSLDTLVQASKQMLEKYIEENNKVIDSVIGNIITNCTELQTVQTSVKTLQDDITTIQATQKLLDETTLNLNKYDATIGKPDVKYQRG